MGDRLYSSNPADRAKDILNHYFKLLMDKVGINYDQDTQVELDQIIDDIVEASKTQIKNDMPDLVSEANRELKYRKHLEE
jgi:hypothetical protein